MDFPFFVSKGFVNFGQNKTTRYVLCLRFVFC